MAIKFHVRLDEYERSMLKNLIKQEKTRVAQHKKRNAQIVQDINENKYSLTYEKRLKPSVSNQLLFAGCVSGWSKKGLK